MSEELNRKICDGFWDTLGGSMALNSALSELQKEGHKIEIKTNKFGNVGLSSISEIYVDGKSIIGLNNPGF